MNNQQLEAAAQNPYEAETPTALPNQENMSLPAYIREVQKQAQQAKSAPQVELVEEEEQL